MSRSFLDDALAHHVWATLWLIDACLRSLESSWGARPRDLRLDPGDDAPPRGGRHVLPCTPDERSCPRDRSGSDGSRGAESRDGGRRTGLERAPRRGPRPGRRRDGRRRGGLSARRLAPRPDRPGDPPCDRSSEPDLHCLTTLGLEPPLIDVWAFGGET